MREAETGSLLKSRSLPSPEVLSFSAGERQGVQDEARD